MVVLMTMALAMTALKGSNKSTDASTADALAQDTAENFIYGLPATGSFWTATVFPNPYQSDTVTLGNQPFQREIQVIDLGATSPGLRQVVIRITWQSGATGRAGLGTQVSEVTRLVAQP